MVELQQLVDALGPGVVTVAAAPLGQTVPVSDVVLRDPRDRAALTAGSLVLCVGMEPAGAPPEVGGKPAAIVLRGTEPLSDVLRVFAAERGTFPDARTVARPWTVRVAVSQDAGRSWTVTDAGGDPVFTGPQSESLDLTYDMLGVALDTGGYLHLAFPRRVTQDGVELNQVDYTRQVAGRPLGGR